jgi:hypothetical protein
MFFVGIVLSFVLGFSYLYIIAGYLKNWHALKFLPRRNNLDNIPLLRETLLTKKRPLSRKYITGGKMSVNTTLTIPVKTDKGYEFTNTTYLKLISGEAGYEPAFTSKDSITCP